MSHLILQSPEQELIEGIAFITSKYPDYSQDEFIDRASQAPYSLEMIRKALKDIHLENDFLKIPLIDCFIGNSDRHHSNWAVLKNKTTNDFQISPLYDNGSSLCCYINEADAPKYLKDKTRYDALAFGKSRSMIRINSIKRPRHVEMFAYIKNHYFEYIAETIERLRLFTPNHINDMVSDYPDSLIHPDIKRLLIKVLIDRRSIMVS